MIAMPIYRSWVSLQRPPNQLARVAYMLTSIEHGPFGPWLLACRLEPGAEIWIADDQWQHGGVQLRGTGECGAEGEQDARHEGERPHGDS
jgi:hypothetical protein